MRQSACRVVNQMAWNKALILGLVPDADLGWACRGSTYGF